MLYKMPNKKPSIMFIIGQPGSGKTTYINDSYQNNYLTTILNNVSMMLWEDHN